MTQTGMFTGPSRGLAGKLSRGLTSRRGARISLIAVLVGVLALFGLLSGAEAPGGNAQAPATSESMRASELLAIFEGADVQPVLVVATRTAGGPLTQADQAALQALAPQLTQLSDNEATGPMLSDDGEAGVLVVPVNAPAHSTNTDSATADSASDAPTTADAVAQLRADLGEHEVPGLTMQVTGGPAFGADVAAAFDGADFTLLFVTILIVAILLIATYRSPVLWLVPLTVVALSDWLASLATAALGSALELQFDAGIISVLVFGAGTNYALLLISRYREELLLTDDHRRALAAAWRGSAPAIVASNVTVVLSLATLAFAVIPGTRGLGLSAALGLVIALGMVLFALPPVLAICGRRVFWPFVPRPGQAPKRAGLWQRTASFVVRTPGRSIIAAGLLLAVMMTGLAGTTVGLTQLDKFRVPAESAAGLETLSQHFPAGEAQPTLIVTQSAQAGDVVAAVRDIDGVVRAHPAGETKNGELTKIMVTGEYAPGSPAALDQVTQIRAAVHAIPAAEALVGGGGATDLDARAGNERDLLVIAPLILLVSFVVLLVLLRSLVAPVLLLITNVASAAAAIGAGAWLSRTLMGQHALDAQVPLLAFLFLVALGIDYSIFLVHRARDEAVAHGTRDGMVRAVTHTGGVITSAGIVLAAVFAALGVLPLVVLGQLGLIVGVGVIVDTLVVRTVIVPALFGLLGDRIWWPGGGARRANDAAASH
ncbi:RND superfamily putative drug exporter [Leucobacter exalbidus]|uniref:RND superfamily putative drug exporter n=1 Tax=Leucobacter exalbidus TaxID=662960 RepID=A0A940T480_9MICO|nr:MMPL family transporter [Leucobacter exalbidus]MBP1326613.1 RND superfamily putative drug exporter [Leucobacter exalbidus]